VKTTTTTTLTTMAKKKARTSLLLLLKNLPRSHPVLLVARLLADLDPSIHLLLPPWFLL